MDPLSLRTKDLVLLHLRMAKSLSMAGKHLPPLKIPRKAPRSDLLREAGAVSAGKDGGVEKEAPLPQLTGALGPSNELQGRFLEGGPSFPESTGTFVKTPKGRDEAGEVIPPVEWDKKPRYAARWIHTFNDPYHDILNRKAKRPDQLRWLIAGIPNVILAQHRLKVLELVRIKWKPCWVPLHMTIRTGEVIEKELEESKNRYDSLSPDNKEALRRDIPKFVERVLGRVTLTEDTCFDISQIHRFGIINLGGEDVEVVKADFKPTWEHSSALSRVKGLWHDLSLRRIEACSKLLKDSSTPTLQEFLKYSQELKVLTQE